MNVQTNTYVSLSYDILEKVLRKILPYFFALVFITTALGAFYGYLEHDMWRVGDWLINYQGGMVRRGLLGEIIYQLADFSHLTPGIYVAFFQIFFYSIFLFSSYALLKKQDLLLPYTFLIFSPFIFTFQINDFQGGFRKEIIYFAILAVITLSATARKSVTFEKMFYMTLLIYPAVILTHEMLVVFLPYLLIVYISVVKLTKKKTIIIGLLVVPSFISFIASIFYSGSESQAIKIYQSIIGENYIVIWGGGIASLASNPSDGLQSVIYGIKHEHYFYYLFTAVLSSLAYIPIYKKLRIIFTNKSSLFLAIVSVIGSVPMFVFASDWGRFIYIHLVTLFFLSLVPTSKISNHYEYPLQQSSRILKVLYILFLIAYSSLWYIPHTWSPIAYAKNYKQLNVFAFTKPYEKVFLHFFPKFK